MVVSLLRWRYWRWWMRRLTTLKEQSTAQPWLRKSRWVKRQPTTPPVPPDQICATWVGKTWSLLTWLRHKLQCSPDPGWRLRKSRNGKVIPARFSHQIFLGNWSSKETDQVSFLCWLGHVLNGHYFGKLNFYNIFADYVTEPRNSL